MLGYGELIWKDGMCKIVIHNEALKFYSCIFHYIFIHYFMTVFFENKFLVES
jgi:hypothetical protein